MYRLTTHPNEWTRDRAIRDLHAHGYNWFLFPGIERFIRTADLESLAANVP
jgi:hypothetical protein